MSLQTLHEQFVSIAPFDPALQVTLQALVDGKAKPPGSLGRIEALATQLGQIQNRTDPRIDKASLLVFAGDHGLTEEGVSAYPPAVTVAMIRLFLSGRGSANAFARATGVDVRVVDAGVAADLPTHPGLIDAKIRFGTRNAAREPALTADEAARAVRRGIEVARRVIAGGTDLLVVGEMGIGNTSSAALLLHRLGPAPLADCVGAGTGHDAVGMARKLAAIERAAARTPATEPMQVLAEFGGCEIAMMAGAMLGAASARCAVLVDGFISCAAALVAIRLDPRVRSYCVFAHVSAERGAAALLAALDAQPLFDLQLRLGEGTGALLAVPMVRAAAALLSDVADLSDVLAGT